MSDAGSIMLPKLCQSSLKLLQDHWQHQELQACRIGPATSQPLVLVLWCPLRQL